MPVGLVSAFILPKDFEYVCVPSLHVLRRLDLTGPGSCKKGLASFGRLVFYQNEFFISEAIQLTVMFPRATSLCTKEKSLKCGSKIGSERVSSLRKCSNSIENRIYHLCHFDSFGRRPQRIIASEHFPKTFGKRVVSSTKVLVLFQMPNSAKPHLDHLHPSLRLVDSCPFEKIAGKIPR
jgi:hypothetical protein